MDINCKALLFIFHLPPLQDSTRTTTHILKQVQMYVCVYIPISYSLRYRGSLFIFVRLAHEAIALLRTYLNKKINNTYNFLKLGHTTLPNNSLGCGVQYRFKRTVCSARGQGAHPSSGAFVTRTCRKTSYASHVPICLFKFYRFTLQFFMLYVFLNRIHRSCETCKNGIFFRAF